MRVAVASSDGARVSKHFGRSACWLVFELVDGQIARREVRENNFTHHHPHGEGHHDQTHNHTEIIEALQDCEAVVSAGMGWRAAAELRSHGIEPYLLDHPCKPETAVFLYLAGKLAPAEENSCRGHH